MTALRLVSHVLCPYAQRVAIALAEKGVPFTRQDIDLADRPDWFRAISPLGKVPLLVVGEGAVLFESAVICEYIEETQPGPALHPADPLARARHRGWVEFASALLAGIGALYAAPDEAAYRARAADLSARIGRLEAEVSGGPCFAGDRFSLVDAAFAPAFRYFDGFEALLPPLGVFDAAPRVSAWRAALAARPSVRGAVVADYPGRLEAFLRRRGSYLSTLMRA
jgi:glutathione S-transferase